MIEVEVFWRRKPRTVYGLMIPRECKLSQMREALAEAVDLPLDRQKVVKLSWQQQSFAALHFPDESVVVANDRICVYEVLPLGPIGCHFSAVHRKVEPRAGCLLGPENITTFGTPVICTVNSESESQDTDDDQRWSTQRELVRAVWNEVCGNSLYWSVFLSC